jgi:hypothetical protein
MWVPGQPVPPPEAPDPALAAAAGLPPPDTPCPRLAAPVPLPPGDAARAATVDAILADCEPGDPVLASVWRLLRSVLRARTASVTLVSAHQAWFRGGCDAAPAPGPAPRGRVLCAYSLIGEPDVRRGRVEGGSGSGCGAGRSPRAPSTFSSQVLSNSDLNMGATRAEAVGGQSG